MDFSIVIKLLVVLVASLVIFSLYAYFRVISPYISANREKSILPAIILKEKTVVVDGIEFSYWTNNIQNPTKILVMLPPSSDTGDSFEEFAKLFPENILIIAPDYPGRGKTAVINGMDTIPVVANRVDVLLKYLLKDKNFDLVAPSFGGAVGTALVKNNDLKIDKIFLIGTGEFFAPDQKLIFHILFAPAVYSEKFRNLYEDLLINRLELFKEIAKESPRDILEQWLSIIDYKIDISTPLNTPAVIITLTKDNIVQPESIAKLQKVYKNNQIFTLGILHDPSAFSNKDLIKLIETNL